MIFLGSVFDRGRWGRGGSETKGPKKEKQQQQQSARQRRGGAKMVGVQQGGTKKKGAVFEKANPGTNRVQPDTEKQQCGVQKLVVSGGVFGRKQKKEEGEEFSSRQRVGRCFRPAAKTARPACWSRSQPKKTTGVDAHTLKHDVKAVCRGGWGSRVGVVHEVVDDLGGEKGGVSGLPGRAFRRTRAGVPTPLPPNAPAPSPSPPP